MMIENSFKSSNEALNLSLSSKMSYSDIQFRFALYNFLFWSGVFVIITNKYELSRLKHTLIQITFEYISNTSKLKKLLKIKDKIFDAYFRNNILTDLNATIRTINQLITTVSNFFLTNSANAPNLGKFIFIKLKRFVTLFMDIKRSFQTIIDTFSFNFRRVLLMPVRFRNTLLGCANELKSFWLQIEQIIQIVRLPIEFLSLIGRFVKSVANFLHRLEKPKIDRMF